MVTFLDLGQTRYQIGNTPSKAAKDFYSRIERPGMFRDPVLAS